MTPNTGQGLDVFSPFTVAHGGPDALGVPAWDFSTNANACGPEPTALQAVRGADPCRYPDPGFDALRKKLATFHGVDDPGRIVIAASASEFIMRLSAAVALRLPGARVAWPHPGYADYARAAFATGLLPGPADQARLLWHTQPGSPLGGLAPLPPHRDDAVAVVDMAYAPLQLDGEPAAPPARAWQLHSPNKALGLTGVRGAYAVAPDLPAARTWLRVLAALAPSWPLGAQGVALLDAWATPQAQAWVRASLDTLRGWKRDQIRLCEGWGWRCATSATPFFVAHWPDVRGLSGTAGPQRPPTPASALLDPLRALGVKLRDAAPLGLPGAVRLSVQPPAAQQALASAWAKICGAEPPMEVIHPQTTEEDL